MARMSVDDSVLRDPRITLLSQLLGWSRRETLGCLIEIWAVCYDRVDSALGVKVINLIAQRDGFADFMLEVELAANTPSGKLRIAGAKERINYLTNLKQWGREGGIKSAESRDKEVKGSAKPTVEAPVKPPHNPPSPDPLPSPPPDPPPPPDPVPAIPAQPTAGGKKPKTAMPDGWVPSRSEANLEAEETAKARGIDLREELKNLRDWAKANNAKKADWDATWRNWTRNARPKSGQATSRAQTALDKQMERIRMLEEQERAEGEKHDQA